uniref:Vacuolar protein sorting-associated protein 52 homolog n=1 Tax=Paramoeba aestuarina TaxID=180227 RepID=A0A7S4PBY8_9EUKA
MLLYKRESSLFFSWAMAATSNEEKAKAELFSDAAKPAHDFFSDMGLEDIEEPELNFENLDLTNEEIDFDELDELIDKFQQDERVKEALLLGLDMRDYGKQVEVNLRDEERSAVDDYIAVTSQLLHLHDEINGCDEILTRMESLLSGFQSDLGNISCEIKALRDQSSALSVQLNNRKEVADKLGDYIDHVAITPQLASGIFEGEVNESYIKYILALNKKMVYVNQMHEKNEQLASYADVDPQLKSLRNEATTKIKKFLLQQIYLLKKPKTNTSIFQQNVLLKYKLLYSFLAKHNSETASAVRNAYIETMSDIYLNNCRLYLSNLDRLHKPVGKGSDVMGGADDAGKSWFSFRFETERQSVFSLDNREKVMDELHSNPIIPHEAAKNGTTYTYEVLFRSMNFYLIDLVTTEYNFCVEFFGREVDTFSPIFRDVIDSYVDDVRSYLKGSYDCLGILLVIKVARGIQKIMLSRRINALQSYFKTISGLLWPRFQNVFQLHMESLQTLHTKPEILGDRSDVRPHFIIRRYAEFSCAVRVIGVTYSDGRLAKYLAAMLKTIEGLFPLLQSQIKSPKMKAVQQINNFDLILSVFDTVSVESPETTRFNELREKAVAMFIEEELLTHFKELISLVNNFEKNAENAPPAMIEKIILYFHDNWKKLLKQVHSDVMTKYFSNFKSGAGILKSTLEQMASYYEKYTEIAKQSFKNSSKPMIKEFIPPTNVHYEINQHYIIDF